MSFITPEHRTEQALAERHRADHIRAPRHLIRHRAEIIASGVCGCFYCLAIF
jgi:hypothetical protein